MDSDTQRKLLRKIIIYRLSDLVQFIYRSSNVCNEILILELFVLLLSPYLVVDRNYPLSTPISHFGRVMAMRGNLVDIGSKLVIETLDFLMLTLKQLLDYIPAVASVLFRHHIDRGFFRFQHLEYFLHCGLVHYVANVRITPNAPVLRQSLFSVPQH
jgi:hypothetical protein